MKQIQFNWKESKTLGNLGTLSTLGTLYKPNLMH